MGTSGGIVSGLDCSTGSGKAAYNAPHTVEVLSPDTFVIPILYAADGNPATRGAWAPVQSGTWKKLTAIHTAVVTALKSPEVSKRLAAMSSTAIGNQPEEFGVFLKSEVESIARIVKKLKLAAD